MTRAGDKTSPSAQAIRITASTRPTLRAALLFALSVPAALIVIILFSEAWYISFYVPCAVLTLIIIDMGMILPVRAPYLEFKAPQRLYVGQYYMAPLKITAEDYKRRTRIDALLEQNGPAAAHEPSSGIMHDGALEISLPIAAQRRGKIGINAIWLRWKSPLGLLEVKRRQTVGEVIEVGPDVNGIHEEALQFFARDAIYGIKNQRMRGEGTEFESLCEYAQGMDTRFIDWKRSARHRKLLCKEFRQERNHQIVFGFDTGHLMMEPINGVPRLDHAIRAGLLLGWISLYSGDLVGGCGFDEHFRHFIRPGRGMPYFTQLQRFASGLDYHTEETNFTLGLAELNSRLQRRAMVVLFTEFIDVISAELLLESLQIMTKKHLVVFVTMRDPLLGRLLHSEPDEFFNVAEAVVAGDFIRERAIVLERAARMGVHCLDVPASGVSSALLNRYLLIKQRGLL